MFPHSGPFLQDVTMSDDTHSVFLARQQWQGYSDKDEKSDTCLGISLGLLPGGCVALDTFNPAGRISCVQNIGDH
jgi:hypothetical protein